MDELHCIVAVAQFRGDLDLNTGFGLKAAAFQLFDAGRADRDPVVALHAGIRQRLLKSGRTRLGFIGDAQYAQTNLERYDGFLDAHRALGIPVDPSLCMTGPIGLRRHYEEISQFLDGLPQLPDGIVCPSDFIAHFVSQYFSLTRRKPPEGFVLTGFDNNAEYANVAERITTVNVETSALGKRLARKLMFRVDYPRAPEEVCYFSTDILYRGPLAQG